MLCTFARVMVHLQLPSSIAVFSSIIRVHLHSSSAAQHTCLTLLRWARPVFTQFRSPCDVSPHASYHTTLLPAVVEPHPVYFAHQTPCSRADLSRHTPALRWASPCQPWRIDHLAQKLMPYVATVVVHVLGG